MFGNPKSLWPSKVFCLIAILMCFVGLAHGEPLILVANPKSQVSQMNKSEIKDILLGRKIFTSNESRIRVFLPSLDDQAARDFVHSYTGMDQQQFLAYWRRRLFSGRGTPPLFVEPSSEIITRVQGSDGGLGLVPSTQDKKDLNTVSIQD